MVPRTFVGSNWIVLVCSHFGCWTVACSIMARKGGVTDLARAWEQEAEVRANARMQRAAPGLVLAIYSCMLQFQKVPSFWPQLRLFAKGTKSPGRRWQRMRSF